MNFFKSILSLLLLVAVITGANAQCGSITYSTPTVSGGTVTFNVIYTPPSGGVNISSLDLNFSVSSPAVVTAVANGFATNNTFTATTFRLRRTSAGAIPQATTLATISFTLAPCQATSVSLSFGGIFYHLLDLV